MIITIELTEKKYTAMICLFLITLLGIFFVWGMKAEDHFASISLEGKQGYYRNYDDRVTKEIQDRDIFFHNIGHSIEEARKADIILLGHSMFLWAMRSDLIEEFERKHGIKIYNLAMAGDASGEFLRLIIKKWRLKPNLWVINADDHAADFFSISFDDFGQFGRSSSINTIKYNRITAYSHVIGRNTRWQIEDLTERLFPKKITKDIFKGSGLSAFRSVNNGGWYVEKIPEYTEPNNATIKLTRTQDCHTNAEEIKLAKRYLNKIGQKTIFTLIPYFEFCPGRVKELGNALNVEYIIPPDPTVYTSTDGGGHLDKKGAIAFTTFFLANLEKTEAFKNLLAEKKSNGT